eukprot:RCo037942
MSASPSVVCGAIPPAQLVYDERERRRNAFLAGLFAGVVSILGTFWLDVRKVQRQIRGQQFSLVKGMLPAILSQAMRTGITYCGFDSFGLHLERRGYTGLHWDFFAAASGAVLGETIACPLDVWKNSSIKNQSIRTFSVPGHILRTSGPLTFFNGIVAAALRKSISNGGLLSLGPYSVHYASVAVKSVVPPEHHGSAVVRTASKLLGGGLAGGLMEVLTLPLDKTKVFSQALVNPSTGRHYRSEEGR